MRYIITAVGKADFMKKILSVVLAISLAATLFCACSKSNSSNDTPQTADFSLKYTYDTVYYDYDSSIFHAYEEVCKAVINRDSDVRVNTGYFNKVQQLLYTSFPLNALVQKYSVKDDDSGISISYNYEQAEHVEKVNLFNKKILEIEKACNISTASNEEYVINVYHYISSHIKQSKNVAINSFDTVLKGEGSSFSYANVFEYLLLQNDIDAYHIIGADASDVSWGLSAAALDNKVYYFDPMTEFLNNGGKSLYYFGMTDADLKSEGIKSVKFSNNGVPSPVNDKRFAACRKCEKWEIKNRCLLVTVNGGKIVKIALK